MSAAFFMLGVCGFLLVSLACWDLPCGGLARAACHVKTAAFHVSQASCQLMQGLDHGL
jgi:hypothetical protein